MKFSPLILALVFSPLTFSGEITVDNDIKVLAVNGVETKMSFFGSNKIEVDDGPQQLVVKFSRTFGNEDLIESKPYIFTVDVYGNTNIKTDKFRSKSHAANNVDKNITWYVTNSKREYAIKNSDTLNGKGFMPYSDLEGLIDDYNHQHNITDEVNNISKKTVAAHSEKDSSKNALIEEYKIATKEQKKQFKMWLIENETN